MSIQIYYKNVYGVPKCYMVESATSAAIMRLTGRVTINQRDLDSIAALGIEVTEVIAPR